MRHFYILVNQTSFGIAERSPVCCGIGGSPKAYHYVPLKNMVTEIVERTGRG